MCESKARHSHATELGHSMSQESKSKAGALDGIRVLEFSALIAGPSCARYLADHGAEVIKIERFPDGDVGRVSNAGPLRRGPLWVRTIGGKKGLCLDLSQPEGLEIARDLVKRSDVIVEAFTPGVMARLGSVGTIAGGSIPSSSCARSRASAKQGPMPAGRATPILRTP